eukprot:1057082-Alexandrium_andersonii.AAC.1
MLRRHAVRARSQHPPSPRPPCARQLAPALLESRGIRVAVLSGPAWESWEGARLLSQLRRAPRAPRRRRPWTRT